MSGINPRLLRLATTDDAVERNQLAIQCADENIPNSADILIKLLDDPRTLNARGTLLYALSEMVKKGWLTVQNIGQERLERVYRAGTYESRAEAALLLDLFEKDDIP